MSQLEERKELRNKIMSDDCTIHDLKSIYEKVNTETEVIVAQNDDSTHLYYRDPEKRTIILEKDLLPYEKKYAM